MAAKKNIKYELKRVVLIGALALGLGASVKACNNPENEIVSEKNITLDITQEEFARHADELVTYVEYVNAVKEYNNAISNNLGEDKIKEARMLAVKFGKELAHVTQDKMVDEIIKNSGLNNVTEGTIKSVFDSADGSDYYVLLTTDNDANYTSELYKSTKMPKNVCKTCREMYDVFGYGGDGSSDKWKTEFDNYAKEVDDVAETYMKMVLGKYEMSSSDFDFKSIGSKLKGLR